jgi:altronate hydrolase
MSEITNKKFLQIHPDDNVLVALQDLKKGEVVVWNNGQIITLQDDVNAKHKFFHHMKCRLGMKF